MAVKTEYTVNHEAVEGEKNSIAVMGKLSTLFHARTRSVR